MIVYDAFDAKLVGTPLGHAAILERRNKEDAQSVLSVVRRALRWTRRVEDGESSAHPTGKVPRTGPERATLGSGSGRFRRSRARPDLGRVGACVPRGRTAWTSPSPPEATRRTRARPRARSGPGSSPAGRPWHAAPCFCPCVTDDTLEKEPFCARPRVVACATATFERRADDTNPSPNPRVRTVRRAAGRCPGRDADREGKNENRARTGIQSEHCRFSEIFPVGAESNARRACRSGERKTARSSPPTRHFETRVTEAERAFPRRASSASRAR